MSLINQVLQDLDKRQQGGNTADKPDVDAINPAQASVIHSQLAYSEASKLEGTDFVRPQLQFKSTQALKSNSSKPQFYTVGGLVVSLAMVAGLWLLYQESEPHEASQPAITAAADMADEAAKEITTQAVTATMLAAEDSVEATIGNQTDSSPGFAKTVLTEPPTMTSESVAPEAIISAPITSEPITPRPIRTEAIAAVAKAPEPKANEAVQQHTASLALVSSKANVVVPDESDPDSTLPAQGNMAVTQVVLTPQERANKLMQKAETAENSGRFAEAKRDYLQVLALVPEQSHARKQLLGLYYAQGELGQAMALVEQAISGNPEPWEWVLLKAKLQQGSGAQSMALKTLAAIPEQGLWAKDKWAAQGDIAQKLGEFSIAEKAYKSLTLVEAEKGLWWMGLAYAQDSQQQYSRARISYLMAIQRAGLSSSARTFIENRLQELGEGR